MDKFYFQYGSRSFQRNFSIDSRNKIIISFFGGIISSLFVSASTKILTKEVNKSKLLWKNNPKIQQTILDFLNSRSDIFVTQEDPFNIPCDYYIPNKEVRKYEKYYSDEKVRLAIQEGRSLICAKAGSIEVLLHEYGHHVNTQKQDGSTKIGRVTHSIRPVTDPLSQVAGPVSIFVMDKKIKNPSAAIPTGIILSTEAPKLISEFEASRYAYNKLKQAGANPEVLNHVRKTLGLAFGTYLGAMLFNLCFTLFGFYFINNFK